MRVVRCLRAKSEYLCVHVRISELERAKVVQLTVKRPLICNIVNQ